MSSPENASAAPAEPVVTPPPPASRPREPFLPAHRFWVVGAAVAGAAALLTALWTAGLGHNTNVKANHGPASMPYAESVRVEAGSGYFFTWGVTAFPRTRELAREGVEARYGDTYAQARAVLAQLRADLDAVGLSLRDVVNVRCYLTAPEGGTHDFDGWNRAFKEYFGNWHNPHKPARTTVGISRLFNPEYRLEVEFVVAFPPGRGPLVDGTWHQKWQQRLGRVETNDGWHSYGRRSWVMSTGKAVPTANGFYSGSGLGPADTSNAEARARAQAMIERNPAMAASMAKMLERNYGNVRDQAKSLFTQLGAHLGEAGLGHKDVFFMRMTVFPSTEVSIGESFGAFNQAYGADYNVAANPNRPTRTLVSTPGFAHAKQYLGVEVFAARPPAADGAAPGELLRAVGSRPGQQLDGDLAPGGVLVDGRADLLWMAGVVPAVPADAPFADQIKSAQEVLAGRLASAGGALDRLVHLRFYVARPEIRKADGNLDPVAVKRELDLRVAAWEKHFLKNFGAGAGAVSKHRPALTTLVVEAIPGNHQIELEALGAIE